MQRVLLISMDAVGDAEVDILLDYPNFRALAEQSALVREARSIFLSNTFPVHASIVTGLPQSRHGVLSNTEPLPVKDPRWHFDESNIRATTLWQAAAQKGLRTAAVLWPATARARDIRYNIPEVMARPGKSQAVASLRAGPPPVLLRAFLKYGAMLRGLEQPALDDWGTAAMADILERKCPDLMLMHLTAYDALCHAHGRSSPALEAAYQSLDDNLGLLLRAAGDDAAVIVFSDHAQLDVHTSVSPNAWLVDAEQMTRQNDAYKLAPAGCFVECCGGSAFFYAGTLNAGTIEHFKRTAARSTGFGRFLIDTEMAVCGRAGSAAFGFCAAPGYHYENYPSGEQADHGYPLDYDGYEVFYMVRARGYAPGSCAAGGEIGHITAIVANALGIEMPL